MIKYLGLIALLLFSTCHSEPRNVTSAPVPSVTAASKTASAPGQTAQSFNGTNYLFYLPEGYDREKKRWPLILYLHGKSLRGNDVHMLKDYGLAALLEKGLSISFIVVSPQCPGDKMWINEEDELLALLDHVSSSYPVDPKRIYLTGHSMGARGTWFLASRYPEKFAAIVPMADGPTDLAWAKPLKNVPVWTFHGTIDDLAPFTRTQQFVEALKREGAEVKFTPLPERDHFILDTYENKEIYDWLLQHKRKKLPE
jgi:predicted peptidase